MNKRIFSFLLIFILLCPVLMAAEPYATSGGSSETPSEDSVLRTEADTFPVPVDISLYDESYFPLNPNYPDLDSLVNDSLLFARSDSTFGPGLQTFDYEYFVLYEGNRDIYIYFYNPTYIDKFYLKKSSVVNNSGGVYGSLMYYKYVNYAVNIDGVSCRTNFCIHAEVRNTDSFTVQYTFKNGGSTDSEIDWYFFDYEDDKVNFDFSDDSLYSSYYPIYFSHNPDIIGLDGTYKLFKEASAPETPPGDYDIPVPDVEITDPDTAGLLSGIVQYFNAFLNVIAGFFTSIFYYFQELISDVNSWFENLIDNIAGFFQELFDLIQNWAQSIIDSIADAVNDIKDFFSYLLDPTIDWSQWEDTNIHSLWVLIETNMQIFDFNVAPAETVEIVLDFSSLDSSLSAAGVIVINFDWYIPLRNTFSTIFYIFLYITFAWRLFREFPGIVSGFSGTDDSGGDR